MAYLEVVNGPGVGLQYKLADDQTKIGRHPECHIVLEQVAEVSRWHAQIVREGGEFYVEDLGSRNGTFYNNTRIGQTPCALKDGDVVRISTVEFAFRQTPAAVEKPVGRTIVLPDKMPVVLDQKPAAKVVLVDDEPSGTDLEDSTEPRVMARTDSESAISSPTSAQARMAALFQITRSLGKVLLLDEVLPKVLEVLLRIFQQADRGFIVLQSEPGELEPRSHIARTHTGEQTARISRTIVKYVMDANQAILTANATEDERLGQSQSINELKIRSVMCAPLVDAAGVPFGVIQLDTVEQDEYFRPDDLEVLMSVAIQAGIAIDNARMHEAMLRQKEIEHDLAIAREIQTGFLPQSGPPLDDYRCVDYYHPASHVGGDYFDYIRLPHGRVAIVIADVVGHGVAAAMMMARLSGELASHLQAEPDPCLTITRLNDRLVARGVDRFITLLTCVLDPATHELTIVSAGHMPPIWRRLDGSIEEPGAELPGLPLGVEAGMEYPGRTICLEPGEWLLMYTDGINEAIGSDGQRFSIDRLRQHAREAAEGKQAFDTLIHDVNRFIGERPRLDDMCLVCLQRV